MRNTVSVRGAWRFSLRLSTVGIGRTRPSLQETDNWCRIDGWRRPLLLYANQVQFTNPLAKTPRNSIIEYAVQGVLRAFVIEYFILNIFSDTIKNQAHRVTSQASRRPVENISSSIVFMTRYFLLQCHWLSETG